MRRIVLSGLIMIGAFGSYFVADLPVATYFQHHKGDRLYEIFHFLTRFGQIEYYLVPLLGVYLYYRKRDSIAALKARFVFISLATSGILVLLIKMLAGRFRPEMYFKAHDFGFDFFHVKQTMMSFPSGHSATAMGAAAACALLFPKYRFLFYGFGLLVMISRVVIVRHYPSDILIGALLGVLTSYLLYERYYKQEIEDAA